MKLQTLTASEEEVMRVIWKKGSIYFRGFGQFLSGTETASKYHLHIS